MTLSFVKKVDALHLLTIALLPHVHLLFVVAHKAPKVWVVKNVFHVTSSCMPFVSCSKLVAELEGFWDSLTENVGLRPHEHLELLNFLANNSQPSNILVLHRTSVVGL